MSEVKNKGKKNYADQNEVRKTNYVDQEIYLMVQEKYYQELKKSKKAQQYLKERGITKKQVINHKIGYAPGGTVLRDYLMGKGISRKRLTELGLLNRKEKDFFFKRIMFGNPLYGRDIGTSFLKHLYNHKSGDEQLYNYNSDYEEMLLVEGHFDLLTAERIIEGSNLELPVVSSYGTNGILDRHVYQMKKSNLKRVYVAYDGDAAGRESAIKVAKRIPVKDVRIVKLPSEQDINGYWGQNDNDPEELIERIENSIPHNIFEINEIRKKYKLSSKTAKLEFVNRVAPLIRNNDDLEYIEGLINKGGNKNANRLKKSS